MRCLTLGFGCQASGYRLQASGFWCHRLFENEKLAVIKVI